MVGMVDVYQCLEESTTNDFMINCDGSIESTWVYLIRCNSKLFIVIILGCMVGFDEFGTCLDEEIEQQRKEQNGLWLRLSQET